MPSWHNLRYNSQDWISLWWWGGGSKATSGKSLVYELITTRREPVNLAFIVAWAGVCGRGEQP